MKITHIYFRYPLYSRGCYLTEYLRYLGENDVSSVLISEKYPNGAELPVVKNLTYLWVSRDKSELSFIFRVFKYLSHVEIRTSDVYHSIGTRGVLFGFIAKLIYHKKFVVTVEMVGDSSGGFLSHLSVFSYRYILKLCKPYKIILWSQYYKDKYFKNWNNAVVVPPGIKIIDRSVSRTASWDGPGMAELKIHFVKPLYKPNGTAAITLLDALETYKKKYGSSYKLTLYFRGENQEQEVIDHIKELDAEANVIIEKFLPFDAVNDAIRSSDITILPFSYAPTVSRSLLEAMMVGQLVLVTKYGEISTIIKDGQNGFFISEDSEEIADKIHYVLALSKTQKESIKNNARLSVEKNYNSVINFERNMKIFETSIRNA
ncbi:hypothetical protein A2380_01065 [candidate division WWE3 bacterium RIFOXYB1_FULL_43_24]|uniref:Glycosyl transferase family 1 domain-containing protein n=2 Tax=Katanobacteria TaxID=422282 RepID=A0A0G1AZD8_UNCKA|nr:MAG: hypothetical protein UU92_C0001G0072 [candidate division WWE3 bacterium GW2011_GWA1_42_12]KKS35203.1 MAG: hypothetical protein UU97_C0001G0054 [candidate division WWE3 bacterium GW2011_GWD1_42_14]KKS39446.1 MAG: hypothetical protein UV00_C0001G0014 [candidate division WWE3 bacterium GW2011_GWF1_42_14]KKS40889.1 MAG: hypothetical protein UV03_C0001G0014 [candidate division WWE3 bacterium GW2011_GWE1_42_16]KKS67289.1 MAG: hypothetical protein UV35_C0001G0057 [candidate division WWE3 bacte